MSNGVGLMRLVSWGALQWACERFGLCWANCVSLKLYGIQSWRIDHPDDPLASLKPSTICFDARPEPYDYCGLYGSDHPCYRAVAARRLAEIDGGGA